MCPVPWPVGGDEQRSMRRQAHPGLGFPSKWGGFGAGMRVARLTGSRFKWWSGLSVSAVSPVCPCMRTWTAKCRRTGQMPGGCNWEGVSVQKGVTGLAGPSAEGAGWASAAPEGRPGSAEAHGSDGEGDFCSER